MWDIRLEDCGDNTENTVKLWIQKHAKMRKFHSKWALKRNRSQQFFSDFLSGTLGDTSSQQEKQHNLSVNVSVTSGCLPLARINISHLTPDEGKAKADLGENKQTDLDSGDEEISLSPSLTASISATARLQGPTSSSTPDSGGSRLKLYILISSALIGLLILIFAIIIVLKVRHVTNLHSYVDFPNFRLTARKKRTSWKECGCIGVSATEGKTKRLAST